MIAGYSARGRGGKPAAIAFVQSHVAVRLFLQALLAILGIFPMAAAAAGARVGFADAGQCAECHPEIARRYAATGMARSFYRLARRTEAGEFQNPRAFYHAASDRHYETRVEDGRYFLLRYELEGSRRINVLEREIHYVLGSGNRARSYLHRTPDNRLIQLPLTWYTARGGYWEMSPGYDRADHLDFRREIDFECFACHNAYPDVEAGADSYGMPSRFPFNLPQGIDCQRCHGPGARHIVAARAGRGAVRDAIVNPARLTPSLQREICMQCHLETTSGPLPHSILRHDAGWFSYRPGQPLASWALFFDHPEDSPLREKFEVVSSFYRLRKSACFQRSGDRMTCTTCHDPHAPAAGDGANHRYDQACLGCHAQATQHAKAGCAGCHMPKRPANDAPHVVMTDHLVQRRPAAAPGAALDEPYRGPVKLYYPQTSAKDPELRLYEAVAQVRDASNLTAGIPRLQQALRNATPRTGFFHFELAEALRQAGRHAEAAAMYREALRRAGVRPAWQLGLANALAATGNLEQAAGAAEQGLKRWPGDARLANLLGDLYGRSGRTAAAIRILEGVSATLPEAAINLGVVLSAAGRLEEARQAFERAMLHQPDSASAHNNLAVLLLRQRKPQEALRHAAEAARLAPGDLPNRLTHATVLARLERYGEAAAEWEAALAIDPDQPETHMNLGSARRARGDLGGAIRQYRRAVELKPSLAPAHFHLAVSLEEINKAEAAERHYREAIRGGLDSGAAHLRLGLLLTRAGKPEEGRRLLEQAARSADPRVRPQALKALGR
jgi:predicted CXXCH cytochrome family protein